MPTKKKSGKARAGTRKPAKSATKPRKAKPKQSKRAMELVKAQKFVDAMGGRRNANALIKQHQANLAKNKKAGARVKKKRASLVKKAGR